MEELRQEFLDEAIPKLENLQARLETEELSEDFEREIFRTLHTLKGTSQTFNLNVSGKFAHEIENLLQAKRDNQISETAGFAPLLKEGVGLLLETFQNAARKKEAVFPVDFTLKLRSLIPGYSSHVATSSSSSAAAASAENLSSLVPPRFWAQLSRHEKDSLTSAISSGNLFYLIEVGFDFAEFAGRFKELRETLSERGEIVANFPSPRFGSENKIGFQIFFVSPKDKNEIIETLEPFGAALIFQNAESDFAGDLKGILGQTVLTGEKGAQALGKRVEFDVKADETKISRQRLKSISDILLHLVRNAVDHGIETTGKIKIELSNKENALLLRVADDGRGIDAEKIRARAIAKNLISTDENLTKDELLKLIFAHGFSTSEKVSEISGRGVGLDVVQDAVRKVGGEIRVESETGKGTTFEIYLPKDERDQEG